MHPVPPRACAWPVPLSCRAAQSLSAPVLALAILAASLGGAWADVLVADGMPVPPPQVTRPAPNAADASAGHRWTQVRIEAGERSVVVPAAQAERLAQLLARLWAAESEPAVAGGQAALRLELAHGNKEIGELELVGNRWRWTPLGEGKPRLLRPSPALSTATREEAERLLQK